jgi:hypothetical protein
VIFGDHGQRKKTVHESVCVAFDDDLITYESIIFDLNLRVCQIEGDGLCRYGGAHKQQARSCPQRALTSGEKFLSVFPSSITQNICINKAKYKHS